MPVPQQPDGSAQRARPAIPLDDPEMDRAARLANLAWTWLRDRGAARSHVERLRALQAAGLVHDEAYFGRLARPRR